MCATLYGQRLLPGSGFPCMLSFFLRREALLMWAHKRLILLYKYFNIFEGWTDCVYGGVRTFLMTRGSRLETILLRELFLSLSTFWIKKMESLFWRFYCIYFMLGSFLSPKHPRNCKCVTPKFQNLHYETFIIWIKPKNDFNCKNKQHRVVK